ncbi:hypothetical protein BG262_06460 [Floricoccus penangensis]|uniref:LicD/FKTN/FKRP nucleotidyltransferase domain-containing protein n=1 Tax=Floricoccus penangensis TaxID=1859475 RepID=A0A9Q5JEI8_9LACT|nr:LicD family protein [Floricoccus penangensis]OFI45913.1 hypothetical protein BG262_06460 [Floricoccus penangensis]
MEDNQRRMQFVELDIFKEFCKIVEKHNLTYYALGGSMLGAVRHEGFIPWDDDIDLGMPREDYEKFINEYYKELPKNLKIRNFKTDSTYRYYITRIQDTNYKVIEKRNKDIESFTYISIDIFPLDGLPNNKIRKFVHENRVMYHRMKMALGNFDTIDKERKRNLAEKIIISISKVIPVTKIFNPNNEKYKIDSLLKKYSINDSNFVSNMMGAYRKKEITPQSVVGMGETYKFEDTSIRGFKDYDKYLTSLYGDYMKLPSKEERTAKEHFEILRDDIDE